MFVIRQVGKGEDMVRSILDEHDVLIREYRQREEQIKIYESQERYEDAKLMTWYNEGLDRAFSQIFGYAIRDAKLITHKGE